MKCGHTDGTFHNQFSTNPALSLKERPLQAETMQLRPGVPTRAAQGQSSDHSADVPRDHFGEGMAAWMGR